VLAYALFTLRGAEVVSRAVVPQPRAALAVANADPAVA
jgi:hypothetical protein